MFQYYARIFDMKDKKVGYFHVPKCGSRTIIAWKALIDNPELINKKPDWFQESRKKVEYHEIRSLVKVTRSIDFPIKFCVVRDPVDRFLSAFVNRVLFHKTIPNIKDDISFDEFLSTYDENINTEAYSKFKSHIEPMVHFLGPNSEFYTHIFNLREINNVKKLLEDTYQIQLPDLHLQQSGGINKPVPTTEQIAWIREKYQQDYYAYGKWV